MPEYQKIAITITSRYPRNWRVRIPLYPSHFQSNFGDKYFSDFFPIEMLGQLWRGVCVFVGYPVGILTGQFQIFQILAPSTRFTSTFPAGQFHPRLSMRSIPKIYFNIQPYLPSPDGAGSAPPRNERVWNPLRNFRYRMPWVRFQLTSEI